MEEPKIISEATGLFGGIFGNWKIIAVAISLFIGLYAWHVIRVDSLESQQVAALETQKNGLTAQCTNDKKITTEAQNALQDDRDRIASERDALKLHKPAACKLSVTGQTDIVTGRPGGHAGQIEIDYDALADYGAECETYRSEVVTLSKFIDAERAPR